MRCNAKTLWAGQESNLRKLTLMGLQPIPFDHSGTDPKLVVGRQWIVASDQQPKGES